MGGPSRCWLGFAPETRARSAAVVPALARTADHLVVNPCEMAQPAKIGSDLFASSLLTLTGTAKRNSGATAAMHAQCKCAAQCLCKWLHTAQRGVDVGVGGSATAARSGSIHEPARGVSPTARRTPSASVSVARRSRTHRSNTVAVTSRSAGAPRTPDGALSGTRPNEARTFRTRLIGPPSRLQRTATCFYARHQATGPAERLHPDVAPKRCAEALRREQSRVSCVAGTPVTKCGRAYSRVNLPGKLLRS